MKDLIAPANTDDQQDYILSKLVEAISDFGTSGLITGDKDGSMNIDTLIKHMGKG